MKHMIPTVEEIAQYEVHKNVRCFDNTIYTGKEVKQIAIAVAKLHVEAALKAAHKNQQLPEEDLEFTLSAYPLTKIK